jgi:hypothetical protein
MRGEQLLELLTQSRLAGACLVKVRGSFFRRAAVQGSLEQSLVGQIGRIHGLPAISSLWHMEFVLKRDYHRTIPHAQPNADNERCTSHPQPKTAFHQNVSVDAPSNEIPMQKGSSAGSLDRRALCPE